MSPNTPDCYKLEDDASAWTSIATVNKITWFNGGVVIKGTDGNPDKLWVMNSLSDYIFSDGTVEVGPAIPGSFEFKVDSKYPFSSLFEMLGRNTQEEIHLPSRSFHLN